MRSSEFRGKVIRHFRGGWGARLTEPMRTWLRTRLGALRPCWRRLCPDHEVPQLHRGNLIRWINESLRRSLKKFRFRLPRIVESTTQAEAVVRTVQPTVLDKYCAHVVVEQIMINDEEGRTLMSSADVARFLGIAPRTVCLWAECSELPGIKIGRQWRFLRKDIERWTDTRLRARLDAGFDRGVLTARNVGAAQGASLRRTRSVPASR